MKCIECGADIYEGVEKCPYCKTLTRGVRDDEKFRNFDFKYTITSEEQIDMIRKSAKKSGKKSGKKGIGVKASIEKALASRRAAKRAARRAARRGEELPAEIETPEVNSVTENTETQMVAEIEEPTYERENTEKKKRNTKTETEREKKKGFSFSMPKVDLKSFRLDTGSKEQKIRRFVSLGIALVLVILVIWGIIAMFGAIFGGSSVVGTYAYVKDNALYMVYNGKLKLVSEGIIIEDFLNKASVEGNAVSADAIIAEENIIHTTEDGKVTYFFKDYEPELDRGTLCMVKNGNVKNVKKISEATHNSVVMTKNGGKILYLSSTIVNGERGALNYWKDGMKESFKITSDIDCGTYEFSADGNWVLFIQNLIREEKRGDLYAKDLKDLKAEKQKVEANVCQLFGSNKDGNVHLFGMDYNTADKSFDICAVGKNGKVMRLGERTALSPVVYEKKNSMLVLGADDDGNPATNNLYTVDIKSGKKDRIDQGVSDIVKISGDEKIVIYRKVYNTAPMIADYYAYSKGKQAIAVANYVVIDPELVSEIPQIAISEDCKTLLFISNYEKMKGGGVLSLTKYNNGKAKPEEIAEVAYSCYAIDGNKFVVNKDYNSSKNVFNIYTLDGKKLKPLKEAVYPNMFGVSQKGNNIYYISDYNAETRKGNLQCMNVKGKTKVIDLNVTNFTVTENDDVFSYKNANIEGTKFDLWFIKNSKQKSKELDKDVAAMVKY